MPPFNLPWSTFGALVVVAATIALAVLWALWDRRRERSEDRSHEGAGEEEGAAS